MTASRSPRSPIEDPSRIQESSDLSGIVVSSGSGIVVDVGGSIWTNAHVVKGCRRIRTRCDEKLVALDVVGIDAENDLALLESKSTCGAAAVFRDGDTIQLGDEVLAVGFPLHGQLSDAPSVSSGIVSNALGPGNDARLFQFTAPIQPGNSGGPLVDTSGLVAGVVVATLTSAKFPNEAQALPQNVNFAIRANVARSFMESKGVEYRKQPPAARKTTSELVQSTSSIVRSVQCLD
jgi:S1-C subfamily serine protease